MPGLLGSGFRGGALGSDEGLGSEAQPGAIDSGSIDEQSVVEKRCRKDREIATVRCFFLCWVDLKYFVSGGVGLCVDGGVV